MLSNPYSFVNKQLQEDGITKIELTPNTPAEIITDFISWNDDKENQWKEVKDIVESAPKLQTQKNY